MTVTMGPIFSSHMRESYKILSRGNRIFEAKSSKISVMISVNMVADHRNKEIEKFVGRP